MDGEVMEQLALDLGIDVAPAETVVSRANEAAFALVARWPSWPHPVQLLTGPAGSGKSHLARAFARTSGASLVAGQDLAADMALSLAAGPVVVDDADRADERALFHLINAVRQSGTSLLLTASRRPGGSLPDLVSRMQAAPEAVLDPPDDALLKRVMAEAFARRQLAPGPEVIAFLVTRMERTLHSAVEMAARLDREGLARRQGPTRHLAAKVLQEAGSRSPEFVP